MVWVYDDTPTNEYGITIEKYVYSRSKNKQLAKNTERIISLYNFLKSHKFKNSNELRDSVFLDKDKKSPVFSEDQSKKLFHMLKTQKGGDRDIINNLIGRVVNTARNYTPEIILTPIDYATPFILILRTAERAPALGPFISIWLDAATSALPVIASSIQNITPTVIGFLPIPEAGPIGAIIGWAVGAIFVFMAISINISRGRFGEGFIDSFLLIPFVGTSLHNAASKSEEFVLKAAMNRLKVIKSAKSIPLVGETVSGVINNYTPDLLSDGTVNPQPPVTPPPKLGLPAGGKRFSTMKRKFSKWQKTIRRRRSARR